jgi:hypothetical protein
MRPRVAVVLAGVLASGMAATLLATAPDPFTGTWQLNLAKSKLSPPVPRSVVSYIECGGKSASVREDIVDATGQRQTATVKAAFDGKDYPIVGSPLADAVSYQRIDSHTLKGTRKKGGKVPVYETVVVSPDGKTMIAVSGAGLENGRSVNLGRLLMFPIVTCSTVHNESLPMGIPDSVISNARLPLAQVRVAIVAPVRVSIVNPAFPETRRGDGCAGCRAARRPLSQT